MKIKIVTTGNETVTISGVKDWSLTQEGDMHVLNDERHLLATFARGTWFYVQKTEEE